MNMADRGAACRAPQIELPIFMILKEKFLNWQGAVLIPSTDSSHHAND
jgi:hypothetical protein